MSNKHTDEYLENKKQDFYEATPNEREAIIEELRNEGYIDEVEYLENYQKEKDLECAECYTQEQIEKANEVAKEQLYNNSLNK